MKRAPAADAADPGIRELFQRFSLHEKAITGLDVAPSWWLKADGLPIHDVNGRNDDLAPPAGFKSGLRVI
jgi:hypothetical protein